MTDPIANRGSEGLAAVLAGCINTVEFAARDRCVRLAMEGDWPYLWMDATYVKVRQAGRIVSVGVFVAVGVISDGRRELLGMDIGPSEAETFWTAFLRKLARRGLRGVRLVVSDSHEGIKAVVSKVLTATLAAPPGPPSDQARGHVSCAMPWRMQVVPGVGSSRPSSPPPSPRMMRPPPASNGTG